MQANASKQGRFFLNRGSPVLKFLSYSLPYGFFRKANIRVLGHVQTQGNKLIKAAKRAGAFLLAHCQGALVQHDWFHCAVVPSNSKHEHK